MKRFIETQPKFKSQVILVLPGMTRLRLEAKRTLFRLTLIAALRLFRCSIHPIPSKTLGLSGLCPIPRAGSWDRPELAVPYTRLRIIPTETLLTHFTNGTAPSGSASPPSNPHNYTDRRFISKLGRVQKKYK